MAIDLGSIVEVETEYAADRPRGRKPLKGILMAGAKKGSDGDVGTQFPPDAKGVVTINVKEITESARSVPYMKADLVRVCRVNEDFALSFFQLDYQDWADRAQKGEQVVFNEANAVGKIIMGKRGFELLISEIKGIADKVGIKWPTSSKE